MASSQSSSRRPASATQPRALQPRALSASLGAGPVAPEGTCLGHVVDGCRGQRPRGERWSGGARRQQGWLTTNDPRAAPGRRRARSCRWSRPWPPSTAGRRCLPRTHDFSVPLVWMRLTRHGGDAHACQRDASLCRHGRRALQRCGGILHRLLRRLRCQHSNRAGSSARLEQRSCRGAGGWRACAPCEARWAGWPSAVKQGGREDGEGEQHRRSTGQTPESASKMTTDTCRRVS